MKPRIPCNVGDRFGNLLVTKVWSEAFYPHRSKQKVCECKCDCGKIIVVRATSLRHEGKSQCGCKDSRGMKNVFSVGDKYGLLTILKVWSQKFDNHSKEKVCECKCDCGNIMVTRGRNLRSGHKLSCGCLQQRCNSNHYAWRGYKEISKSIWTSITKGCKRGSRILEFDITIEQGWDLFISQDRKCAISGINIEFPYKSRQYDPSKRTASLDRIDSSKGYTIDNVQWVHKIVNNMKQALSDTEFIEWCKRIAKYNG